MNAVYSYVPVTLDMCSGDFAPAWIHVSLFVGVHIQINHKVYCQAVCSCVTDIGYVHLNEWFSNWGPRRRTLNFNFGTIWDRPYYAFNNNCP